MRVLIAVDEGSYAEAEIEFIGMHNFAPGTHFRLLHSVEPSNVQDAFASLYGQTEQNAVLSERLRKAEQDVRLLRSRLATKLAPEAIIDTCVVCGKAAETIINTAEGWDADLIVMGSHGRTGLSRFLLGSTSLQVLSHAPCSVAIVRLPKKSHELPLHFEETDLPESMITYQNQCFEPTEAQRKSS